LDAKAFAISSSNASFFGSGFFSFFFGAGAMLSNSANVFRTEAKASGGFGFRRGLILASLAGAFGFALTFGFASIFGFGFTLGSGTDGNAATSSFISGSGGGGGASTTFGGGGGGGGGGLAFGGAGVAFG
jgi:hypothetical protein